MASYSRNDVVLVRYPFTNIAGAKVRPGVVVNAPHVSHDLFIVPLTSKVLGLLPGEFQLIDWQNAGLNVPTAVKRGLFTLHESLVIKNVGSLSPPDSQSLETSLRQWLGL